MVATALAEFWLSMVMVPLDVHEVKTKLPLGLEDIWRSPAFCQVSVPDGAVAPEVGGFAAKDTLYCA